MLIFMFYYFIGVVSNKNYLHFTETTQFRNSFETLSKLFRFQFHFVARQFNTWRTFDADVAGFQVAANLACALQHAMVDGGNRHRAATSPRAEWIQLVEDVQLAAEVAVVDGETAAEAHATEVRRLHHDHLVVGRTAGNELLCLAELGYHTCRQRTENL